MKKIATLGIIALFCAGSIAFADDALVMPARVGRVYMTNSYAFANSGYDEDGDYNEIESGDGAFKAYNIGFAVEYGINEWITGAVQWAPGWNVWSDVDSSFAPISDSEANINGLYDIFVGAKLQIVGEQAPVQNSMFRVAVAPGVKIPLPATDMSDQVTNMFNGDPVTVANLDRHLFALGGRAYFDYIINEMFFANLYSEFIYYPVEGDSKYYSPETSTSTEKIDYGYKLTIEAEPHFETMINQGLRFSAGLPITYITTPNFKVDGTEVNDSGTAILNLGPNASVFFLNTIVPIELKLGYSFPVYGKNNAATNSLTLQAKVYFKL